MSLPPLFWSFTAWLRRLAKNPLALTAYPPYLLASLPDDIFSRVHEHLTMCYDWGSIPDDWLTSETFCLLKGKGQWQEPDRWRPIAMSNSICRLFMCWIYSKLYPLVTPLLHPRQFGGTWEAQKVMTQATSVVSVAGPNVYLIPSEHRPEGAITDGSKSGNPPITGASAILRDGCIAMCRLLGLPNSYKVELNGILLGSHFSPERERLHLGCKGL